MKSILSILLLASALAAHGQIADGAISESQLVFVDGVYDHNDVFYFQPPSGGQDGLRFWDGATQRPHYLALGPNLAMDEVNGNLAVVDLTTANIGNISEFMAEALEATDESEFKSLMGLPASPFSGAWADLTGKPSTFPPSSHTHPWSDITSRPTALSGYGITDAVSTGGSYNNPAWLNTLDYSKLISKPTTLTGFGITDAQPLDPDLTAIAALPTDSFGRSLLTQTSAANVRSLIGAGTGNGTVTSVNLSSTDLTVSGGPIISSGSITANLATTGVTAASYTFGNFTVNSKGQLTAASSGTPYSVASPSTGNSLTIGNSTTVATPTGTAFQPRSGGPCHIIINAQLSGALGLNELVTVAMSSTQNGTYVTVASDVLLIGVLGLTLDRSIASIPVPANYWIKVGRGGTAASATYTRFDIN